MNLPAARVLKKVRCLIEERISLLESHKKDNIREERNQHLSLRIHRHEQAGRRTNSADHVDYRKPLCNGGDGVGDCGGGGSGL